MEQYEIENIIDGKCTPEESERFFQTLKNDPALAQRYARLKNERVFASMPDSVNIRRPLRTTLWHWTTSAAAVLFLPVTLLLGYIWWHHNQPKAEYESIQTIACAGMQYNVNNGVRGKVMLPDSSTVWLNCGSSMEVPVQFSENQRVVSLSGEGYFDIQSNPDRPFYIKTPQNILVKVTGTEFNLSCYETEAIFRLMLVKGKVELLCSEKERIVVKPRETIEINQNSKKERGTLQSDVGKATAWMNGHLIFDNTPMAEVEMRLERWYGVNISILNKEIYKINFTADFRSESMVQVLELLKITSDIQYTMKGTEVTLFTR